MGFRINTNVAALSAHANALSNNRAIDNSLNRLNSGFRINSAADDASGMAIADSLRSQASSLGQAIMNANDAIGIVQTADKAMDEQIKILDTIKNKAIQSAQDGQTTESRRSLQADISRLMEELDNIGNTTSFNGQKLLAGTFSNKEFQIGAYSNETVKASIGATTSDKIGLTRFETGHNVRASDLTSVANFTFKNVDGINDITFEPVKLADDSGNIKSGMGLGALVEAINKASDKTGVKASVTVQSVFEQPIKAGSTTAGFSINGVMIGAIDVKEKDGNGALRSAINSVKDQTGVEASVDSKGRLVLANRDGRGIKVEDNAQAIRPDKDLHDLVTNTADGTMKKGVDLNKSNTWTTPAGEAGSILNSSNSFADVKMAHGVQDALIQQGGTDAVKELAKIPEVYGVFTSGQDEALATLKADLSKTIKAEILDKNAATGKANEKALLDANAKALDAKIQDASSLKEISDLLTDFTKTSAGTGAGKNEFDDANIDGGGMADAFKAAAATNVNTYATSMDKTVKATEEAIKNQGIDITQGAGNRLLTGLAGLKGAVEAATDTGTGLTGTGGFAAIATLAEKESVFNQKTSSMSEPLNLNGLKPDITGALNLIDPALLAFRDFQETSERALEDLKIDLTSSLNTLLASDSNPAAKDPAAATGAEDATAAKAKAELDGQVKTALKGIADAKDISELEKAIGTFMTDTGLEGLADITVDPSTFDDKGATTLKSKDIITDIVGLVKTYANTMNTAAAKAEKALTDANVDVTTEGSLGKAINDQLVAIKDATTKAVANEDTDGIINTAGTKYQKANLAKLTNAVKTAETAAATAIDEKANPVVKDMLDSLKGLEKQTTVEGANAAIKDLSDKLDTIIRDAAGKGMDTEEAQNGMIAHAMKQFLAGVKVGLNEPNKEGLAGIIGLNVDNSTNFGRLSLVSTNGRDIQVEVADANGFVTNSTVGYDKNVAEKTVSLRETNSTIDRDLADAMGHNSEDWQATDRGDNINGYPAGVMTLKGAQAMMNIAEAAQKALEAVRSDLGSVQNQLIATVNNISVTQVNVKAAESNIRDVDFAQESATFSKHQILAQSGVYAMSQANAVQQNVMRLLQ